MKNNLNSVYFNAGCRREHVQYFSSSIQCYAFGEMMLQNTKIFTMRHADWRKIEKIEYKSKIVHSILWATVPTLCVLIVRKENRLFHFVGRGIIIL
jgi:hypothetical protein